MEVLVLAKGTSLANLTVYKIVYSAVVDLTSCDKTGQVGFTFSFQFLFAICRDLSQVV
jgi:hypothetical protein